jgi:hypothetical protein
MNKQDQQIVKMVEYALKEKNATMLFKLAELLNKRGHFEIDLRILEQSLNNK